MTEILERKTYQKGEIVFREGGEGNCAFVVQSGAVEIVKIIDGKTKILGSVGPGGIFGEMALIDDQPRMASARVAQGGTFVIISRAVFEQKMAKADPFIRGLLKIFANNIRSMAKSQTKGAPKASAAVQELAAESTEVE